jgi:hypothetical protein
MGVFADELRAGIDEAADKMEAARRDGDRYGAEAYRERLGFLRRVARRHGLGPWPCPEPAARPAGTRSEDAAALVQDSGRGPGAAGWGAVRAGAVP